jgi:uncharacterized protein with beta-barrel porin domain
LAPGNSIGTLTVQGNLVLAAAASYLVAISGAASGLTEVTGTATLGGATVRASPSGSVTKRYTILNATGGVSGTFNPAVIGNFTSNLSPRLSYDANNAYLNFALNFNSTGLNVNQQNVANALTNAFNSTGGIPLALANLLPAGLTQASGEIATGSQQATFDAMSLFIGLLTDHDPFVAGRDGGIASASGPSSYAADDEREISYAANGERLPKGERDAYAAMHRKAPMMRDSVHDPHWGVWAAGFGGSQNTDGNTALGSNTATSRVYGTAVGADYLFTQRTIAGFTMAGGGTNFSINGLGSGRSDMFQAGAFVRHHNGPAYVTAALAYGWQDVTTDRTVTVAGINQLRARFNVNSLAGRVEAGYRVAAPWIGGVGVTPYAAGQLTPYLLPAYAESVLAGTNSFALSYGAKDVTASRSELGFRADKPFAMHDAILTLRGRFAWAHNFNTDRNIAATFQTLPTATFTVNGAVQAHESALTSLSAETKWLNGWSAAATFEGEFSDVRRSYAGKGVVRYVW